MNALDNDIEPPDRAPARDSKRAADVFQPGPESADCPADYRAGAGHDGGHGGYGDGFPRRRSRHFWRLPGGHGQRGVPLCVQRPGRWRRHHCVPVYRQPGSGAGPKICRPADDDLGAAVLPISGRHCSRQPRAAGPAFRPGFASGDGRRFDLPDYHRLFLPLYGRLQRLYRPVSGHGSLQRHHEDFPGHEYPQRGRQRCRRIRAPRRRCGRSRSLSGFSGLCLSCCWKKNDPSPCG